MSIDRPKRDSTSLEELAIFNMWELARTVWGVIEIRQMLAKKTTHSWPGIKLPT